MKLKDHFDSNYRYIPAAARPPALQRAPALAGN